MKHRRTRITDVAKAAGVSSSAVSFAFNHPERLSGDTVKSILKVADELGYSPRPNSRANLSQGRGVFGLLTPHSINTAYANPYYTHLLEGLASCLEPEGYSILLISAENHSLYRAFPQIEGLFAVSIDEKSPELRPFRKRGLPIIIIDGKASSASSITFNDELGAWQAAYFLLGLGHRKVLCMVPYSKRDAPNGSTSETVQARVEGYKRGFVDRDLPWPGVPLATLPCAPDAARTFLQYWMATAPDKRPTGVLAASDAIAFGVMLAAEQIGLKIPHDLSIVGFDDVPAAALAGLTTINHGTLQKGLEAGQIMLQQMDGEFSSSQRIMPAELVLRRSADLPARGSHPLSVSNSIRAQYYCSLVLP